MSRLTCVSNGVGGLSGWRWVRSNTPARLEFPVKDGRYSVIQLTRRAALRYQLDHHRRRRWMGLHRMPRLPYQGES